MVKDQDVVMSTSLIAVAYVAIMFATKVVAVFLFNALPSQNHMRLQWMRAQRWIPHFFYCGL